jgi:hypothetical protein
MALLATALHSKHSLKNTEHPAQSVIGSSPQALDRPISIDSSDLINNNVPIFLSKVAGYVEGRWMPV